MIKLRLFFILLVVILALSRPSSAQAHAIDSANIDQYTRLEIGLKSIRIHYILNMGNLPAYLERRAIDTSADAELSGEEQEAYLNRKIPQLLGQMPLTVNGLPVELQVVSKELSFPVITVPDVEGGLVTMQLVLDLEAPLPEISGSTAFEFHNNNYIDGTGWREIVVRPLDGLSLNDPALEQDLSNELQAYPTAMKANLLDVRSVSFSAASAGVALAVTPQKTALPQTVGLPGQPKVYDAFAGLINTPTLTPQVIFFALLLSLVLGAGHALTPGHGKTIVGAYLVGSRGQAKHAILLGLVTTLTHTSGVFVLGFVTMFVSSYILPERLFPWLELTSGVLVAVIGLGMFWQRLVDLMRYGYVPQHSHDHNDHGHGHDHYDHSHEHPHEHGPHTHSHLPPDGQPASLRGLLALGVSGGLLPCPSALVVMLGAIALHRIAFGMLLIVAFSVGLASVLTGIGLLLVYAQRWFERFPSDGRIIRAVSVISAAVVALAGIVISVGALAQMGFWG